MCVSYSNDKISSLLRHPVPGCRSSARLVAGMQASTGAHSRSFHARSRGRSYSDCHTRSDCHSACGVNRHERGGSS